MDFAGFDSRHPTYSTPVTFCQKYFVHQVTLIIFLWRSCRRKRIKRVQITLTKLSFFAYSKKRESTYENYNLTAFMLQVLNTVRPDSCCVRACMPPTCFQSRIDLIRVSWELLSGWRSEVLSFIKLPRFEMCRWTFYCWQVESNCIRSILQTEDWHVCFSSSIWILVCKNGNPLRWLCGQTC